MDVLTETNLTGLGTKHSGKVRDIYEQQDRLILVATDRHSSFDRIIAHVPHKGQVLNQISAFWFEKTTDIIQNHVIAIPDPNVTVGKKVKPLPIEAVMRGYITGVTGTALWTQYEAGKRDFGNFSLPDGMRKNQKLENPVFTPTTKSDEHDRPVSPQEAVAEGIITKERIEEVEQISRALFARGTELAAASDLILVDTKYEFGVDEHDALMLIDEIHTPDSSRYWNLSSYQARFDAGEEPEYFDKEFLRLWFKDNCDPYNDPVLPEAPTELVEELSRRYRQMYERITGTTFIPGDVPLLERIQRNLTDYAK